MTAATVTSRLRKARIDGVDDAEIRFVHDTLGEYKPDIICEWGTNVGNTARLFYEVVRDLKLHCPIHTTDLHDTIPLLRPSDQGRKRGHHVLGLDVKLHVGDGDTVAIMQSKRSKAKRPLVFIDNNHERDATMQAIVRVSGCVRHAMIMVHDQRADHTGRPEAYHEAAYFAALHTDWYRVTSVDSTHGIVALWPLWTPPWL